MWKNVSEGEKIAMAMYHNKTRELAETKRELNDLKKQLKVMVQHLTELKVLNRSLCEDINYLVHNKPHNA